MFGALDVLQMKEDVLKFLAAGTHLWSSTSTKGKVTEVSYVNLPNIALYNIDSPLCYMGTAILCNKGAHSAVTKEEFQGKWTTPASEFSAAQPERLDWSESVQVTSVSIQQFPTEGWPASH
ncbi:hypothetical protein A6R68_09905, partial [Neotoma lepida]